MYRIFIAALKVARLFVTEKIFGAFKKKPSYVFVVTSRDEDYFIRVTKDETAAMECCEGMERYYKYSKIELK